MKLSLEIIKEQWNLNYGKYGSNMEYTMKSHTFYRSVRFLSDQITSLKSETIYVVYRTNPDILRLAADAEPDVALIFSENTDENEDEILYDLYKESVSCEIARITSYDAMETFNHLLAIFEKYDDYDSRFLSAFHEELPLQKILDLICEMIGNPAYVVDLNYRALAMDQNQDLPFYSINWKRIREQGYLPYNIVHSILNNNEWDEFRTQSGPVLMKTKEFSTPFLALNIWENQKVQWHFFVCELLKKIAPADIDLIRMISEYLRQALTSDTRYRSLQEKYYEPFLRQAANGSIHSRQILLEQLHALKWKEHDRYCVMEVNVDGYDGYTRELITKGLIPMAEVMSFQYEGRLLLLIRLPEDMTYEEFSKKADDLLKKSGYLVALSVEYNTFSQMNLYCAQTQRILAITDKKENGCISYPQVFFRDFMLHEVAPKDIRQYAPTGYMKLQELDEKHQSNLNKTLFFYLRWDRNLVKTASELHIHRNTLIYRLGLIEQTIPEDLQNPDVRLWYRMIYEWE